VVIAEMSSSRSVRVPPALLWRHSGRAVVALAAGAMEAVAVEGIDAVVFVSIAESELAADVDELLADLVFAGVDAASAEHIIGRLESIGLVELGPGR